MWICRNCNLQKPPADFTPEVDEIGCCFICPACSYRNILIAIREEDGPLSMMQPDLDWPGGTSWRD